MAGLIEFIELHLSGTDLHNWQRWSFILWTLHNGKLMFEFNLGLPSTYTAILKDLALDQADILLRLPMERAGVIDRLYLKSSDCAEVLLVNLRCFS